MTSPAYHGRSRVDINNLGRRRNVDADVGQSQGEEKKQNQKKTDQVLRPCPIVTIESLEEKPFTEGDADIPMAMGTLDRPHWL